MLTYSKMRCFYSYCKLFKGQDKYEGEKFHSLSKIYLQEITAIISTIKMRQRSPNMMAINLSGSNSKSIKEN